MGIPAETFGSAEEFLATYDRTRPGCLILDYRLPGASGSDLQQRLKSIGNLLPVIMVSGHADIDTAVNSLRIGAVNFLQKPFELKKLCKEIETALELDKARRTRAAEEEAAARLVGNLTQKEKEVFDLVAHGRTNKEISNQIGISVRAVEDRRQRMMNKLECSSLSDVIRTARQLPSPP